MASTTLKVKVFGGTPPFSLKIMLFKGNDVVKNINKPGSFEMTLDDLSGNYSLIVSGPNPMSGDRKTIISLDETEITLSPDSDPNPATRTGKVYMVQYFFKA
ncbi:MAG: hypothetical protein NTW29_01945 [Bacteroidetes bacterium]|nr:hypothetical protein [Bacteroidota bacterium]